MIVLSSGTAGMCHEDTSLACGWCHTVFMLGFMYPGALPAADEAGLFSAGLKLYRRVEPSPLPGEWWVRMCGVVDVASARLTCLWVLYDLVKRLPSATEASWWSELLDRSIRLVKLNASSGLSGRDTMSYMALAHSISMVELAARDESQEAMLNESGVADALEYGILHGFTYIGTSVSAYASGAAVALVGRNEGGKVLRREAVHAVLERLHLYFDVDAAFSGLPPKMVMASFGRVSIMAISDANKKHMLEFEPLIDMLLECLIINDDNHRKGQDGADALQEASAGVLHELSLYGPGAAALRSHSDAVSTLHKLCEVGTKVSKERGAAALFELEEDKRPKQASPDTDDGSGTGLVSGQKPPPHVMASYNWDHQGVILRVVSALQSRGYLVWVDTEQMKGATVDTMALAVEGSEVVLIGVSRAYKESSNCRMEAQYALQKKKALVPLMLTKRYEADGWLGLLLGTSMWYAFYGETLSSVAVFDDRMDALVREIGVRGRADAVVVAEPQATQLHAELQLQLRELRPTQLKKRARESGASTEAIEATDDAETPKQALIALIAELEEQPEADEAARAELAALKVTELKRRARELRVSDAAIEEADYAPSPKEALVALLLSASPAAAGWGALGA